jgi:lactate permease
MEGAAGFGAPVAISAAMLTGLGFKPFRAAALCLLANTAPVAFGSIAIPLVTLAGVTGLPLDALSADTGRIIPPVALIIPAYLILILGGWRALRIVLPGAAVCGIAFAGTQFAVSNWIGAPLTDIVAAVVSVGALMALLRVWRPRGTYATTPHSHSRATVARAWAPYALLVVIILLWSVDAIRKPLNAASMSFAWPGLHNHITRVAPAVTKPGLYPAVYNFNYLAASGTACMVTALLAAVVLAVSPRRLLGIMLASARQLALSILTMAAVLALAFLMNYCGATATLGLAFTATGALFPFFSSLLGWVGVFLTGSDTSSNALFGNLQVVAAGKLGLNAILMAASNTSGGVMGKMISLQSIAVAAAATGMPSSDEARLFRFTLKHSVLLATIVGLIVTFFAYIAPSWVK